MATSSDGSSNSHSHSHSHPTQTSHRRRRPPPKLGANLCLAQPVSWSHICPHCGRAFPSCHALGGHQNAHRQLKKEAALAAKRLCLGVGFTRTVRILSFSAPPGVMIPNTDLKLSPPAPTLVIKPIPIRLYANGAGVAFELENNGNAVGPEFKPLMEMNFIPEVPMAAPADHGGGLSVSDEGTVSDASSFAVDSNEELDLDLKL